MRNRFRCKIKKLFQLCICLSAIFVSRYNFFGSHLWDFFVHLLWSIFQSILHMHCYTYSKITVQNILIINGNESTLLKMIWYIYGWICKWWEICTMNSKYIANQCKRQLIYLQNKIPVCPLAHEPSSNNFFTSNFLFFKCKCAALIFIKYSVILLKSNLNLTKMFLPACF